MGEAFDKTLAARIEHTLLQADATRAQIKKLCDDAVSFQFHGVAVNGTHVSWAAQRLVGSGRAVIATIGFPLGAMGTKAKAAEARAAVEDGADELDMVINVGALKEGNDTLVQEDIAAVVTAACGRPVKVILETGLLSSDEIVRACKRAMAAGAQFVKTATGFGPRGATPEDVRLMRRTVGAHFGVKVAGGIRTRAQALAMIEAGADRIGSSASVTIVSATADLRTESVDSSVLKA